MKDGVTGGLVVSKKVGPRSLGQWQHTCAKRRPMDSAPPAPPNSTHHAVFPHKDGVHIRDCFIGVAGLHYSS